ncbi:MAG: prepilin-type N-terminal cleavage/methylation domain-containing protein [Pyrinomonadaceae bacterium]|nr:prepilin-type N-terminal cleavage/methylation domain-containing protein [Pyrinomonadaceae bacterium]MCX7639863.1 prepilin-type N-terminal cleavage/methylation domain-containing protein [Pyrinomonadaceae bacterium]MDW8304035.1 prepilin-type N-terminal cleavage/methylation domain-containing protein [Acidobacteriota bacterium]
MQKGFSLIELIIVITVAFILTGISFFLLTSHQRLFKPDEQVLKIADILQEARQRALTQRETMRVEIDLTDNSVRLIDENSPTTHTDDKLIRQISLFPPQEVRIDTRPPGISFDPPEMISVPPATFPISVYPPSVAHNVCTLRFLRNGSVVNAGTDPIGSNASLTSAAIFVWSPRNGNPSQYEIARAITVVGTTGFIRLWEYDPNLSTPNKWKDSRRFSSGGLP